MSPFLHLVWPECNAHPPFRPVATRASATSNREKFSSPLGSTIHALDTSPSSTGVQGSTAGLYCPGSTASTERTVSGSLEIHDPLSFAFTLSVTDCFRVQQVAILRKVCSPPEFVQAQYALNLIVSFRIGFVRDGHKPAPKVYTTFPIFARPQPQNSSIIHDLVRLLGL